MRVITAAAIGLATLGGTAATAARAQAPRTVAAPTAAITISSPQDGASYRLGTRIVVRFRCRAATTCRGTMATGRTFNPRSTGVKSFTVTATDAAGNTIQKTVHYTVWTYVNPLRAVSNLQQSRIDMGVDYSGAGPILAIGRAKVVLASDKLAGPESCWGKTCVPPPGDMIVYRLLDGPFAGKYVYVVEHITIGVRTGQIVRAGERIATLHEGSPNLEIGWAAGRGVYTLAAASGHQFPGPDPGGWSSIEGRNFDQLLVWLGAPAGYVTMAPAGQRMPAGWPALPSMS